MNPIAKRDGLLVEKIGEEIVVLDQSRNRAHRLNRTMAVVWRHCDGKHSTEDLSQVLRLELDFEQADEQVVHMALDQLRRLHLIEFDPVQHEEVEQFSRRELARKLAVATALLPSILSIAVPTPAQAKSTNHADPPSHKDPHKDHDHDDRKDDRDQHDDLGQLPPWKK